jgi:hypothetical protein
MFLKALRFCALAVDCYDCRNLFERLIVWAFAGRHEKALFKYCTKWT